MLFRHNNRYFTYFVVMNYTPCNFLKYFRNISRNISWNISRQKISWNFTSQVVSPSNREDCVVVAVGPGRGAVGSSTESTDTFGKSDEVDDDEVGGGGRRPLSQHSRNAASHCGPNRTISEHGKPASWAIIPTLQQWQHSYSTTQHTSL